MERLKKSGVKFESEKQTLCEVAKLNKMTPQQVYLAMKPEKKTGDTKALPSTPASGLGKRTLADICQEYNLNILEILRGLADNNVKASAEMPFKQIAEQNDMSPRELYAIIEKIANTDR